MVIDHQNEYQDIYKYELSVYLFHQVSDLYSLLCELKNHMTRFIQIIGKLKFK